MRSKRFKVFDSILLVAATVGLGATVSSGGFGPAQGNSTPSSGVPTSSGWDVVLGNKATTSGHNPQVSTGDLLLFGGSTSSFTALKPNGAILNLRKADDSGDASLNAYSATFTNSGVILVGNQGQLNDDVADPQFAGNPSWFVQPNTNKFFGISQSITATSGTSTSVYVSPSLSDGGANSTTVARGLVVYPTINYTGATKTGHYEALVVNAVETNLPTGANYLARFQAGASGGTDRMTLDNTGVLKTFGTGAGTQIANFAQNYNGITQFYVQNTTAGTAGQCEIVVQQDNFNLAMLVNSLSYTGAGFNTAGGINQAAQASFGSSAGATNGMAIAASAGPIIFASAGSGTGQFAINSSGHHGARSNVVYGWTNSTTDPTAALNVGLSSGGAATVKVGNGTANDSSGTLVATTLTGTLSTAAQTNVTSLGTLTSLTMGGTLTMGANTLALASATVSGQPTWNSSQTFPGVTLSGNSTVNAGNNVSWPSGVATNATSGFPIITTTAGTPTGSVAAGAIVFNTAANHFYVSEGGGTWLQVDGGSTPSLSSVLAVGNTSGSNDIVMSVNGTTPQKISFATGGSSASATVPHLLGPTDGTTFISGGQPGGTAAGRGITITGSNGSTTGAGGAISLTPGNGAGTDQNAGGTTISTGSSTGAGTGQLLFQVPIKAASGSGANSAATVLTIDPAGFVYSGRTNATTVGNITMTASAAGSTSGAAGAVSITGGTGGSAVDGGAVSLTGGAGVLATTRAGGAATLAGGQGANFSGSGGGAGGLAKVVGGAAGSGGTDLLAGGVILDTGASTGAGTGILSFKVPAVGASGTTSNSTSTVMSIQGSGLSYTGVQNATVVGNVSFTASQGGSTSGAGGNITLTAGAVGTANQSAGTVTLNGGTDAISSSASSGGNVTLNGGSCTGTTSTGGGGQVSCIAGNGGTTSGAGGQFLGSGGNGSGSTSGAGGSATLQGGNGSAASNNNAAGGATISTGIPTGTGAGDINMRAGFTAASGAGQQNMGDRFRISGHSVTMSNTSATATQILDLNLPNNNSGGGCIVKYCVIASDGTNLDTACGQFFVAANNKAGTVTATVSPTTQTATLEANNNNSGTLTAGAISTTISTTHVQIKIAPAWTTIVPTSVICLVNSESFGNGVVTTSQ